MEDSCSTRCWHTRPADDTDRAARPIPDAIAALLDQPSVTGWARLHADESATTLRNDDGRMLLTDGPFIDSKEYLAGLFLIEAEQPGRGPGHRRGTAPGDQARHRDRGAAHPRRARPWRLTPSSVTTGAACWPPWPGILGDIELAEDAAAEAFAIAAERWPRDGEPANPAGWLVTTARNRAIDQLRRRQVLAAKTKLLARDLEASAAADRRPSWTTPPPSRTSGSS